MGIRDNGYREILDARIAGGEGELFQSGLFQDLAGRGLSGVKLMISDGHKGIQKAVKKSFLGASWQISLTAVSESFGEVENVSCASRASCSKTRNIIRRLRTRSK